ncbi:MAG TPA: 16S rRNA (cytidine(1402)-2'-O)-methyltransferase [SAR86 cluster bacterium]|jgi:16S rRNA (cytidine1402-2'-O)-methyltransferase|nr:16S rRNA (cytidine(1402)-2'-O)-methyltransferase [SAR86 cluster bacterium]HJM15151.1 16S rRNA (cytidine(1402)-2'-O)-methyltransferase [SAR86 cluster bacterium]|tara:strand:+ start:1788 stop:2630 length:843 start_codon:yes stop_codon:yes gene_type:complete
MDNKLGTLYIVATPIGNLNDITNRAIEILNLVDICAAEDTRKSIKLFNAHNINTKLTSYHKFSEKNKSTNLIKELLDGKDIAIISDAGTPLISDPGKYLVNRAIKEGIDIVPIPGATSVITALSVSGFNIDNFKYFGFLPRKKNEREALIREICTSGITSLVFESGKRIGKLLGDISKQLQKEVQILVAREMTKIHETYYRGTALEVVEQLDSSEFGTKGEFVVIVSAFKKFQEEGFTDEEKRIMDLLWDSLPQKEALFLGSKILNKKRNFLYQKKINNK